MRARVTPLLIMSVERFDQSYKENQASIEHFEQFLADRGVKYTKGTGVYLDKQEVSYVFENTSENLKLVKGAVLYYDQDAYLEVSSEARGYLVYRKGSTPIGQLSVSSDKPDSDHTFINNQYLTFKGV